LYVGSGENQNSNNALPDLSMLWLDTVAGASSFSAVVANSTRAGEPVTITLIAGSAAAPMTWALGMAGDFMVSVD
jgi:hypothetical protein